MGSPNTDNLLFSPSIYVYLAYSLGQKVYKQKVLLFGLFLVPALIPNLHHILSFVFFPDFITKNTRDKVAYLFLISRDFVLLAFFILTFHHKINGWLSAKSYGFVLALHTKLGNRIGTPIGSWPISCTGGHVYYHRTFRHIRKGILGYMWMVAFCLWETLYVGRRRWE